MSAADCPGKAMAGGWEWWNRQHQVKYPAPMQATMTPGSAWLAAEHGGQSQRVVGGQRGRQAAASRGERGVPALLLDLLQPAHSAFLTRLCQASGAPVASTAGQATMPRLAALSLACLLVALAPGGSRHGTALGARLPRSLKAAAAAGAASGPASTGRHLLADQAADGSFLQLASQNGSTTDGTATNGRSASRTDGGAAPNGHSAAAPLPEPTVAPLPAAPQPEPAAVPATKQQQEHEQSLGQKLGSAAAGAPGSCLAWGVCLLVLACLSACCAHHTLAMHRKPTRLSAPCRCGRRHCRRRRLVCPGHSGGGRRGRQCCC